MPATADDSPRIPRSSATVTIDPSANTRRRSADIRFELPELNTWRLCNKAVSQPVVMEMVEQWESHGYRLGCVCVDDGWQENGLMGVWRPDPRRFPDVAGLAEDLHARGYALRLWIAPAQAHPGTPIFEELWPQGFLHNNSGRPSFYVGLGTYTLDIRHPRARQHVLETTRMAASQWTADAFKVDFPPFYQPDDEFYRQRDFALPDDARQTMVEEFFALVREALDSVRPGLRVESYPKCHGSMPYIDDMIAGDLVGCDRSWPTLVSHGRRMRDAIGSRDIVPWLEMIWGEGADHPHGGVDWHAGFLEYLAASINLELKLEHSFPPFDYPNARQIQILTSLYGPRNRGVKVLVAGRRTFAVDELIAGGSHVDARTRFLVAPEADMVVRMPTLSLHTSAIDWRCRDVVTGRPVQLRARNEFWGGTSNVCRVEFEARGREVYELWYEGQPTDYFARVLKEHLGSKPDGPAAPAVRPAE
jgi:hypothetical protein